MASTQPTSQFYGAIEGHTVIAAPQCGPGGIMNFNFGHQPDQNEPARRPSKPFSTVAFPRDPDYVDRPDLIAWIKDRCAKPAARAALVGLGGVGKSQLAIQYCHDVREASPHTWVFWVHANTQARFEEAYRNIADRLELPRRHEPSVDVLQLVKEWLCNEEHGRWFMVLDNVDDVDIFHSMTGRKLASYLPQSSNGSILVTSRSRDAAVRLVGKHKDAQEVRIMSEPQAMQLLRTKLDQDVSDEDQMEDAINLLHTLDYIPLAITQAAAYINRGAPRTTIASFLRDFQRNDGNKESLLNRDNGDLRRDPAASNSVIVTWQMSFEQIRKERLSAAHLLSLMSFFNPQGIPGAVLARARRYELYADEGKAADEERTTYKTDDGRIKEYKDEKVEFNEDIDMLRAYSLITAMTEDCTYEMHRLVQFCTQVWLHSSNALDRWRQCFYAIMAKEWPSGNFESWTKCQQLIPHVASFFAEEPRDGLLHRSWVKVLNNAAWYFNSIGQYGDAEALERRVVATLKKVPGHDQAAALRSMDQLATILSRQGKYGEAEELQRQTLLEAESALGKQHPNTLTSMGNLAATLTSQGKYEEAEELHRQTVKAKGKLVGRWHPSTLTSLNNLAILLHEQGKLEAAEEIHRETLEARKQVDGEEHPFTLASMINLAAVLTDQRKYDEAEEMHRRAVEMSEKVLGSEHPSTIQSMYHLASLLHELCRYETAMDLYRRASNRYICVLGPEHPTTMACFDDMSLCEEDMQRKISGSASHDITS